MPPTSGFSGPVCRDYCVFGDHGFLLRTDPEAGKLIGCLLPWDRKGSFEGPRNEFATLGLGLRLVAATNRGGHGKAKTG